MKRNSICQVYWLFILCLSAATSWAGEGKEQPEQPKCRLATLDDEAAWKRLPPRMKELADRRLPIWARALAGPLPYTTAAMLELDHVYRTSDSIDPRLRATIRWVAARANRCTYSQRYAEADLRVAGMSREQVEQLEKSFDTLPEKERAALAFARKLTLQADKVTDAEVAALIAAFGEEQVVAMVLQLAYANFQDRLLLTLDVDVEPNGPLKPLPVRFTGPMPGSSIAANRPQPTDNGKPAPTIELGSDWTSLTFDQALRGMEEQRDKPGRIAVPEWEDIQPFLPAGMPPTRIKWSLVVVGYQPALGPAWMKCLRTFGREADQDPVFEETLFWVITRTNNCFY